MSSLALGWKVQYSGGMAFRTTAVEAAEARGWSRAELARRSGLSVRLIHLLARGRQPGPKAIEGLMRAFADLPYERLFVPSGSSQLQLDRRSKVGKNTQQQNRTVVTA